MELLGIALVLIWGGYFSLTPYDGQTATLPVKMRNVQALDTITFIRADLKIEVEDVYSNLVISNLVPATNFSMSSEGNFIKVSSTFEFPLTFELDSLESIPIGDIEIDAPSDPITGGEAIFDFVYARVFIKDAYDITPGLNHCCKPPGLRDTLQFGGFPPCQGAGTPQISFADVQYEDEGMVVPIYLENLNNPSSSVTVDTLVLEVEATVTGDLVIDSLAIVNSLNSFPGCSLTVVNLDIDSANYSVRIEVIGNCEILSGTDNLFSFVFDGTGGCIQGIKTVVVEYDPPGFAEACVPPVEDAPTDCWRQKGEIYRWCGSNTPIPGVTIYQDTLTPHETLVCQNTTYVQTETTDSEGAYSVEAEASPKRYSLTPSKTENPDCVTTFDLLLVQKHILLNTFTEPEEWIAADANNSGSISTVDLIKMRQLILGVITELPGPQWRFIPENYVFDPPVPTSMPTGYPECLAYPDSTNINFRAIKIGDLNCGCSSSLDIQDTIEVEVSEVIISGGRRLEFESSEFDTLAAFQFGFDFDSDDWVYQEEIEEDLPYMSSDAIGSTGASSGSLNIAWYDSLAQGRTLGTGEKMLSLEFQDQPWVFGGSLLTELALNETDLPALAYKEDGTPVVIRLVANRGHRMLPTVNQTPEEDQQSSFTVTVQPNPTRQGVDFNIDSHKRATAKLVIYDAQGKQVHQFSLNLEMGVNKYRLQEMANWPAGLYWYRVETGNESISGKVLKK